MRTFSGLGYGSGSDDEEEVRGARDAAESEEDSEDGDAVQERIRRKRAAFDKKMREMEEEGEICLDNA